MKSWGRFNSRVGLIHSPPPTSTSFHTSKPLKYIWTNILTNTSFSYSRNLRNNQGQGKGVLEWHAAGRDEKVKVHNRAIVR